MELSTADVSRLIRRSRQQFVDVATERLTVEIAAYGAFPRELLQGDIADVIRRNIELFVQALGTGEQPSGDDLEQLRVSAARRAEERLPLGMMIAAYHLGARVVVERLEVAAGSGDVFVPTELLRLLLDFLKTVCAAAIESYLEEFQLIEAATQTASDRMLDALLSGGPRPALEGYELADEYAVFALAVEQHPDELEPGVDAGMAARRKLRRLRQALRTLSYQQLASLTPEGGLVLVPTAVGLDTAALVRVLGQAAQVPVTAAVTEARPDDVAPAARLAREVLEVALLLDKAPGAYRLEDVSFEYQITRPGPARTALAQTLGHVEDELLLATLRAFLTTGGNRHRTARQVSAHPNTVDNRMRKLALLTGYDPTRPDDATRLRMALLARDAELLP